jgi:hypothetical protein
MNNLSEQLQTWQHVTCEGIHCAGLLDVQGASENVLLVATVGSLANWRSFIWWSSDPVSQYYAIECYRSVVLFCSVLCLYGSCEIQFRVLIFYCYVKKNSYKSCRRKFHHKFPNTTCPSGDTISKLVKKVWTNCILIDIKPLKRNCVLTEGKLMT